MAKKQFKFLLPSIHDKELRRAHGFFVKKIVLYGPLLLIFIFGFYIFGKNNFDLAREIGIRNSFGLNEVLKVSPEINLLSKIKEGMLLLENSNPLEYELRGGELYRKQIALALLNRNTGEVFEHRIWVYEDEIKNYRQTGIINMEPDLSTPSSTANLTAGQAPQLDIKVSANWWNSFNTDYKIENRTELVVVANKYLWLSANLSTLPERSAGKYTEVIYAPYSGGLHTPELVETGKKYIEEKIDLAFSQLENQRVVSRFADSQLATAGIEEDFIRNILLVEHVDPNAFRLSDDEGRSLVERVLVIIGANREKAYRHTGSPAGASGIAQFIRPTYNDIYSKYPQAQLIKDYKLGMAEHVNAVKAMVLFFDEHKRALASKITRKDIVEPLGITEEMLAAAYNGGPSRVTSSINKYGLAWISGQVKLSSGSRILRKETLDYVSKFRAVKGLDLF